MQKLFHGEHHQKESCAFNRTGLLLYPHLAEHARNKNLQPNADEDHTTQDGGFAGEFGAKLFAKAQTCLTDEERDR